MCPERGENPRANAREMLYEIDPRYSIFAKSSRACMYVHTPREEQLTKPRTRDRYHHEGEEDSYIKYAVWEWGEREREREREREDETVGEGDAKRFIVN